MFDRFGASAQLMIDAARNTARDLDHGHVGTEHILMGLLDVPGTTVGGVLAGRGVTADRVREETRRRLATAELSDAGSSAVDTLAAMGIDVEEIRRRADESFGPGRFQFPRASLTPRAKLVFAESLREAKALRHREVEPEHILLGLLTEGEGLAAAVLVTLDVDLPALRADVLARIAPLS